MPTTGADYRWMNLVARVPRKGLAAHRQAAGPGRRWPAAGPPLRRGRSGPGRRTVRRCAARRHPRVDGDALVRLITDDGAGSPAPSSITTGARSPSPRGAELCLAAGGFDHSMDMRWKFQSESLGENASLGAETNTGDAIRIAQDVGAGHRPDGPGVVVPGRGTAARGRSAGHAGRTVAAGLADRRPDRQRFTNEAARLHVVRPAGARAGTLRESRRIDVDHLRPAVPQQLCLCRRIVSAHAHSAGVVRRGHRPPRQTISAELAAHDGGARGTGLADTMSRFNEMCRRRRRFRLRSRARARTTATTAIPRSPPTRTCARSTRVRSTP